MSEEILRCSKNRLILGKQYQPHLRKLEDFILHGANTSQVETDCSRTLG